MTLDTKAVRAPDCNWYQEEDGGDTWQTKCGNYATVTADTPSENGMKFCWYCGGKLLEFPFEYDELESE